MAYNFTQVKDKRNGNALHNFTPLSTTGEFDATKAYSIGELCFYGGSLYRFTSSKASGAWDASKAIVTTIEEEFANYAKIDGYYESLTAGQANQLISDVYEEDKTPYVFRTSGGSIDIGDRETDMLVGGTVAWNQLVNPDSFPTDTRSGVTFTNNGDGSYSVNGTATAQATFRVYINQVVVGHKYLYKGCPTGGSASTYHLTNDIGNGYIQTFSIGGYIAYNIVVENGYTANNLVFKPQVFDLTQMFGSTIADYIYNLETANAGAGVAWFKKLFPKPYYAYNAGELMSVQSVSHDMVEFNAWDEQWEVGSIDGTTGQNISANDCIRSKNYIEVVPNTTYYVGNQDGATIVIHKYDADKNYLGYNNRANATLDMSADTHYIKLRFATAYGTTYKHDCCINLSWDGERDGEYEEYVKHSYALDSDLVLRGIPKLDNGSLYYDGDTYEDDGTVTRKYGIVDLGTLTWVAGFGGFYSSGLHDVAKSPTSYDVPVAVCSKYPWVVGGSGNTGFFVHTSTSYQGYVVIVDPAYTDAATFKTAMSGVYLVYELATPTTESADPYTNPQIVNDFGTEEYVVTEQSGVAVPVGHTTQYLANLKAKLEMMPNSPDGNGDYIVRQNNGENEYVAISDNATVSGLVTRVPVASGENGTYVLKATISGSTITYAWVAE